MKIEIEKFLVWMVIFFVIITLCFKITFLNNYPIIIGFTIGFSVSVLVDWIYSKGFSFLNLFGKIKNK